MTFAKRWRKSYEKENMGVYVKPLFNHLIPYNIMNKRERRSIASKEASIKEIASSLMEITNFFNGLADDEEEKGNNLEDGFGITERSEEMLENANNLRDAADALSCATDSLNDAIDILADITNK